MNRPPAVQHQIAAVVIAMAQHPRLGRELLDDRRPFAAESSACTRPTARRPAIGPEEVLVRRTPAPRSASRCRRPSRYGGYASDLQLLAAHLQLRDERHRLRGRARRARPAWRAEVRLQRHVAEILQADDAELVRVVQDGRDRQRHRLEQARDRDKRHAVEVDRARRAARARWTRCRAAERGSSVDRRRRRSAASPSPRLRSPAGRDAVDPLAYAVRIRNSSARVDPSRIYPGPRRQFAGETEHAARPLEGGAADVSIRLAWTGRSEWAHVQTASRRHQRASLASRRNRHIVGDDALDELSTGPTATRSQRTVLADRGIGRHAGRPRRDRGRPSRAAISADRLAGNRAPSRRRGTRRRSHRRRSPRPAAMTAMSAAVSQGSLSGTDALARLRPPDADDVHTRTGPRVRRVRRARWARR